MANRACRLKERDCEWAAGARSSIEHLGCSLLNTNFHLCCEFKRNLIPALSRNYDLFVFDFMSPLMLSHVTYTEERVELVKKSLLNPETFRAYAKQRKVPLSWFMTLDGKVSTENFSATRSWINSIETFAFLTRFPLAFEQEFPLVFFSLPRLVNRAGEHVGEFPWCISQCLHWTWIEWTQTGESRCGLSNQIDRQSFLFTSLLVCMLSNSSHTLFTAIPR